MKKCEKCGHRFSIAERRMTYSKKTIECPDCSSSYSIEVRTVYSTLIIFVGVQLYLGMIEKVSMLNLIVYLIISLIVWSMFEIMPLGVHKYKKIEK